MRRDLHTTRAPDHRGSQTGEGPRARAGAPKTTAAQRQVPRGRRVAIIVVVAVVLLGGLGVVLTQLGLVVPFPRVTTVAALPALPSGAAYIRVAEDASGDLWVAQSAPGLARDPHDPALLTILAPDQLSGDRVLARMCLGCTGAPGLALARVDDIAPDLTHPHTLYVAGWTAPTAHTASVPVVVEVAWQPAVVQCAPLACGIEITLLAPTTAVTFLGTPADATTPLLTQLLRVGVAPTLALASAHDGTLYCFLSDRGRDSLGDTKYNVIGGFQGLLMYSPLIAEWSEVYVGPAGNQAAQGLSPTSTVTALALDHTGRYLSLADADHQAIYRLDLHDPRVNAGNPYAAAGAITWVAGQPLAAGAYGDRFQGAPGWSGDGGRATAARLNGVRGLATDAAGDLLVSDAGNARLRLITPGGTIWTVAGRGVAAVDGDIGAPLGAGLGGIAGIAADARGRVFVTDGAATDGTGRVRVRQLSWGWSAPASTVTRATQGAGAWVADARAGLVAHNAISVSATVLSAGGCGADDAAGCASTYAVMAGGALPAQAPLALPQRAAGGDVPLADAPTLVASVPGSAAVLVAGATDLTVTATIAGQTAPVAFALPPGATATGMAVLAPQTTAQAARLHGAAYILVAVHGGTDGPALLLYRATADTCGVQPSGECSHFPGTPTLAATLPLPGSSAPGAVAVALSDDASHAVALVAQPGDDALAAIDLSSWLAHGTALAVTSHINVGHPVGALVVRHDALAAYLALSDGGIGVLDTAGWLTGGVPAAAPTPAIVPTGVGSAPVAALALAGDDTRLFAALATGPQGGQLVALAVGDFAQPSPPRVVGTAPTEANPRALSLVGADQRLLLVADPGGANPGTLHAWVTRDPANPAAWLPVPLSLGSVATPLHPVALAP